MMPGFDVTESEMQITSTTAMMLLPHLSLQRSRALQMEMRSAQAAHLHRRVANAPAVAVLEPRALRHAARALGVPPADKHGLPEHSGHERGRLERNARAREQRGRLVRERRVAHCVEAAPREALGGRVVALALRARGPDGLDRGRLVAVHRGKRNDDTALQFVRRVAFGTAQLASHFWCLN
jgi:hypothetical protein